MSTLAKLTKADLIAQINKLVEERAAFQRTVSELTRQVEMLKEGKQIEKAQALANDRVRRMRTLSPERQAEVEARRTAMEAAKAAAIAGKKVQVVTF